MLACNLSSSCGENKAAIFEVIVTMVGNRQYDILLGQFGVIEHDPANRMSIALFQATDDANKYVVGSGSNVSPVVQLVERSS